MTEEEQRWMNLGKAIERACEQLPKDFSIAIELAKDTAISTLFVHNKLSFNICFEEDFLYEEINAAIDFALNTYEE